MPVNAGQPAFETVVFAGNGRASESLNCTNHPSAPKTSPDVDPLILQSRGTRTRSNAQGGETGVAGVAGMQFGGLQGGGGVEVHSVPVFPASFV